MYKDYVFYNRTMSQLRKCCSIISKKKKKKKERKKKKKKSAKPSFLEVMVVIDLKFESKEGKNDRFSLIKKYFVKSPL